MSKVALIAKITCNEGMRDDAVALFKDHVEFVNSEAGTLVYALHTDATDPNLIWFYELYTDQAALGEHGGSEAMKALGGKLRPYTAKRPELTFLAPVAAKGI